MQAAAPAPSSSDAPLAGLRVLEFGQFIAAPAAAQTLADMGADVIKIEPAAGDAARVVGWSRDAYGPMFTAYNRGKRSVVLDLRSNAGRAQARGLAARADVLLQNMRPGSMEKLGLGGEELLAAFPRLIYGQISGFGQSGPASVRPGFDIAAQAESGMMSLNGARDAEPTRVGFTVVDTMAAHALATGVLAVLVRRGSTGRGGLVDVSLIDVAIEALGNAWAEYGLTDEMPLRCGNGQPHTAPAADVIATSDGMVVVSAYTQDHFPRLCAAIDREDMVSDPRFCENIGRVKNRAALRAELSAALQHLSADAASELLTRAGVVVGVVRTMAGVRAGHAGVSADLFVEVGAPGREAVRIPGLPLVIDGMRRRDARLPAIGEHTEEVLKELVAQ